MQKHEVKLGKLIEGTEQRDAIHIAVAPVVAAERLIPGQRIGFVGADRERVGASAETIGVVDPFLRDIIEPEQRFFMLLMPNTIWSLRHEWTHPAFTDDVKKANAQVLIQAVASHHGVSYEELIDAAGDFIRTGDYWIQGGRWEGMGVGDDFWDAYEIVTGVKVPEDDRGSIFSCSC